MEYLNVDYLSDLHLSFYIKSNGNGYNKDSIERFVEKNIKPKVKGDVLVIAGDISEFIDSSIMFLEECSKYYAKIFFVAGNHEYYISNMLNRNMKSEFNYNSLNKIKRICDLTHDNDKIVFLDRTNSNNGIAEYNGFKIAGDTLWYLPKGINGWLFYYLNSNDSRLILSEYSKKDMIYHLHESSMNWYNALPIDLDLIITHTPPVNNKHNSCYYTRVPEFKSSVWIYGHDHIEKDFIKDSTRFISNPWGYESKDFKIKTLNLVKRK